MDDKPLLPFSCILDMSQVLFMVASVALASLLKATTMILAPTTYILMPKVTCLHSKEQRGLEERIAKGSKNKSFYLYGRIEYYSCLALLFSSICC